MSGRRATGVGIITDPDAHGPQEMDTFTCAHCQTIVFLHNPDGTRKADQGGFCIKCFKPVCGPCADLGRCTPIEKRIEQREREANDRRRFLGSIG